MRATRRTFNLKPARDSFMHTACVWSEKLPFARYSVVKEPSGLDPEPRLGHSRAPRAPERPRFTNLVTAAQVGFISPAPPKALKASGQSKWRIPGSNR